MIEAAILCLAMNVYYEARGEGHWGRVAVAHVTLNRAQTPEKVCPTVYSPAQFSWTARVGMVPRDQKAWRDALSVAQRVLAGTTWDVTGGATHFHHTKVRPRWAKRLVKSTQIGNHIFYS